MTKREQFVSYVKQGGQPICSPQIGAGAGFDARLAGKEWLTEVTLEDTLSACERFDMVPMINMGPLPYEEMAPVLAWQETGRRETPRRKEWETQLVTPVGTLTRNYIEEPVNGVMMTKYAVEDGDDLKVLDWYLDVVLDSDFSAQTEHIQKVVRWLDGRAALDVQWGMQPYEILSFPNTVDTVFLANDYPELFTRLMDKVIRLDEKMLDALQKADCDFVFLGGPGAEMLSPKYYENYIIPGSQTVTQMAHARGFQVYSHICSPVEPFLTMGFYNRMGIDLFETLSPPPVGNVQSMGDAITKLDPHICTRGNVGLDALLNKTPAEIRELSLAILEQTRGRKHILAASDYLFYNIPEENVAAMCAAVREFNGA